MPNFLSPPEQDLSIERIKQHLNQLLQMIGTPPDDIRPFPKLVLDYGKPYHYTEESFDESGEQKQCFMNATHLAFGICLTYVEGYIECHGVFVHHAWCVDEDGIILDPTIRYHDGIGGYFGVPFKPDYLRETLTRTKQYGILDYPNRAILSPSVTPDQFLET